MSRISVPAQGRHRSFVDTALNGLCPYFTMFPLVFPLNVLSGRAQPVQRGLDPFSGRGTPNHAARLVGLSSVGIDSSPVAAALTQAKVAVTSPEAILRAYDRIVAAGETGVAPQGEFWEWAFHRDVLRTLVTLR